MKALLFDFDGVIVDSFPFELELGKQFIDSAITIDEYRALFEGNFYEVLQEKYPNIDHERVMKNLYVEYEKRIQVTPMFEGVKELIDSLPLDLPCFIVSSTPSVIIRSYLSRHGIDHRFLDIYGSDIEKSKSRKLHMILERMDLSSSDVLFITDTTGDIKEAKEVGIESIGVTWGFHTEAMIKQAQPYEVISQQGVLKDYVFSLIQ